MCRRLRRRRRFGKRAIESNETKHTKNDTARGGAPLSGGGIFVIASSLTKTPCPTPAEQTSRGGLAAGDGVLIVGVGDHGEEGGDVWVVVDEGQVPAFGLGCGVGDHRFEATATDGFAADAGEDGLAGAAFLRFAYRPCLALGCCMRRSVDPVVGARFFREAAPVCLFATMASGPSLAFLAGGVPAFVGSAVAFDISVCAAPRYAVFRPIVAAFVVHRALPAS